MKKRSLLFLALSLSFFFTIQAQSNLVLNPSFEDTLGCPVMYGETYKAKYWDNGGWEGTSDLFHTCASSDMVGIPLNDLGYQAAGTGKAYAGIISYSGNGGGDQREYIIGKLSVPLTIGQKYYVRFKASCSDDTLGNFGGTPINKLGARFRTTATLTLNPENGTSFVYPDNIAHVFTNVILNDRVNWTGVFGSFIADSAYKYIVIGNFFKDAQTNAIHPGSVGYSNIYYAYYYIDDVCVSTAASICIPLTGMNEKETSDFITIYPNPNQGLIKINNATGEIITTITLHTAQGTEIKKLTNIYTSEYIIDLSTFENGIYFLKIDIGERSIYKHVVKE